MNDSLNNTRLLENRVSSLLPSLWRGFWIWSVIYYALALATISLPIIIASGYLPDYTKLLALTTTICAAALGWAGLNTVVQNFNSAYIALDGAYLKYQKDKDSDKLNEVYLQALKLASGYVPGLPKKTGASDP